MIGGSRLGRVAERDGQQEPAAVGVTRGEGIGAVGRLVPGNGDAGNGGDAAVGELVCLGLKFFRAFLVGQPAAEGP